LTTRLLFSLFFVLFTFHIVYGGKIDSLINVKANLRTGVFKDDTTRISIDIYLYRTLSVKKDLDSVLIMEKSIEEFITNRINESNNSFESAYLSTQLAYFRVRKLRKKKYILEESEFSSIVEETKTLLEGYFEYADSTIQNKAYETSALLYRTTGGQLYRKGQFYESIYEINKGLKMAENCICLGEKMRLHNSAGLSNKKIGAFQEALNHYFAAIDILLKNDDYSNLTSLYSNVGIIYKNIKDFDKAEKFYRKSLSYKGYVRRYHAVANLYGNLGILAKNRKEYKKALLYQDTSYRISDSIGFNLGKISALTNKSQINKIQGNYDQAIENLKLAEELLQQTNDKSRAFSTYLNLAFLYIDTKQLNKAKPYIEKISTLAYTFNNLSQKSQIHLLQSRYYEQKRDYKLSLEHHKLFQKYNDSIFSENAQNNLIAKDLEFDYKRRMYSDSLNNAYMREVQEKEAAAEIEKRDLQIKATRIQLILTGIALLLILILIYIIYKRLRIANKQKLIIEHQKDKLKIKNQEISESIRYAKNIQSTILPTEDKVASVIQKFFILYLPKDVVSGDFYWTAETKDYFYIAAADCTGHGIPGALVSVICCNALNKVVKEEKLDETDTILNRTREIVIEQFQQNKNSLNDGMDISLIRLDKLEWITSEAKNIQFSGANNPLWIVSNQNSEDRFTHYNTNQYGDYLLAEIKGDKMPIGNFLKKKKFTKHNLKLQPGERIYMMSDGFGDQFGGNHENGKKYKSSNLKRFITKNQDKKINDQKEILVREHNNWKGNHEQVDDITIIGIEIR
jgi:serine phosphatase RsbU (regulator of sigma subunit)